LGAEQVLAVCGSLSSRSAKQAALDVARARLLGRPAWRSSPTWTWPGSLPGTLEKALDWLVGSGELYARPVAVLSAGTTRGPFARHELVRTLTWEGAHVVASCGIAAVCTRTRTDAARAITDAADALVGVLEMAGEGRLARVRAAVDAADVDAGHVNPVVERLRPRPPAPEPAVASAGSDPR